jgi:PAS domain-containing protein
MEKKKDNAIRIAKRPIAAAFSYLLLSAVFFALNISDNSIFFAQWLTVSATISLCFTAFSLHIRINDKTLYTSTFNYSVAVLQIVSSIFILTTPIYILDVNEHGHFFQLLSTTNFIVSLVLLYKAYQLRTLKNVFEKELSIFLNTDKESVLIIDNNQTIVAANAMAHDLLLSHDQGLIGLSLSLLLPFRLKKVYNELYNEFRTSDKSGDRTELNNLSYRPISRKLGSLEISLKPLSLIGNIWFEITICELGHEQELEVERAKMLSLFFSQFQINPTPIIIIHCGTLKIEHANSAFVTRFSNKQSHTEGSYLQDLILHEDPQLDFKNTLIANQFCLQTIKTKIKAEYNDPTTMLASAEKIDFNGHAHCLISFSDPSTGIETTQ